MVLPLGMYYNTLIDLYCWAFLLFRYLSILSTLRQSPCWGWARGSSPVRPHALRFALSTVAAGTRPQPSLLQHPRHLQELPGTSFARVQVPFLSLPHKCCWRRLCSELWTP